MHPVLDNVSVLLIQARNTSDMEAQEQTCFSERCRLAAAGFKTANVAHDAIHLGLLDEVDAVMIGGAGEYSAHHEYPWMNDLLRLVRTCADRDLPLFGSCWGHQVIARAFGGEVVHDPAKAEFGCGYIELTQAGQADALFGKFPHRFRANLGHHDRVTRLPENAVELARNASQPNQAFRIEGKPIYGTQFHSELDARREHERLIAYRDYYRSELGGDEAFQRIIDSLAPTTEVDHLLYDFLRRFAIRERV